jgi:hypothetical protein
MDALAIGYGPSEGPVWEPGRGRSFSDVLNGGVHRVRGRILHAAGGLVQGRRDIVLPPARVALAPSR